MDLFDDTSSEKYRHECELRYIASMNLSGRRKYLALVLDKRGVKSLEKLKEGLTEIWKKNKSTKA
jgi:hypothetical protein